MKLFANRDRPAAVGIEVVGLEVAAFISVCLNVSIDGEHPGTLEVQVGGFLRRKGITAQEAIEPDEISNPRSTQDVHCRPVIQLEGSEGVPSYACHNPRQAR